MRLLERGLDTSYQITKLQMFPQIQQPKQIHSSHKKSREKLRWMKKYLSTILEISA